MVMICTFRSSREALSLSQRSQSGRHKQHLRPIAQLVVELNLADLIRRGAHDKMIDRFPTWQKAERVAYYKSARIDSGDCRTGSCTR